MAKIKLPESLQALGEAFFKQSLDLEVSLIQNDVMFQAEKMMEERGMKKKDLAKKMGVSPSYVSQLFGNFTKMSVTDIAKLKIALDMDLDFKFREKHAPSIHVEYEDNALEDEIESRGEVTTGPLSFGYFESSEFEIDSAYENELIGNLKVTKSLNQTLAA